MDGLSRAFNFRAKAFCLWSLFHFDSVKLLSLQNEVLINGHSVRSNSTSTLQEWRNVVNRERELAEMNETVWTDEVRIGSKLAPVAGNCFHCQYDEQ